MANHAGDVATRRDLHAQGEMQAGQRLGHRVLDGVGEVGQTLGAGGKRQVDRQGQDVFRRNQNGGRTDMGSIDRYDSVIDDAP